MPDSASIPLVIYIIIGPVAWAIMFVLMLLGRRRMLRLMHDRYRLPPHPPPVTVLVPAKDEAAGIRKCIEQILSQDYPNFRVIAIDDRSSDGTGAILDEFASKNPQRLRVIHIPPGALPDGWLGKCNALYQGARQTDDEWLFFVDSDVTLAPGAMTDALAISIARKYDALSILTRLECHGFWERLVLPLAAAAWTVMHTVSFTNDDNRTNIAVANGQFFLIRRRAYETVGGHEAVRDQITEDVELMRLLKLRAFRTRFLLGAHLASTRMHATLKQMRHGWGRIYSGTNRQNPSRIIGALLFLILCGFSVYPAIMLGLIQWPRPDWLLASLAHLALMTAYLWLIYYWSGNRVRYALLFPLGGGALVGLLLYALRMCQTGRVVWRDTHFQVPTSLPVHSSFHIHAHEPTVRQKDP